MSTKTCNVSEMVQDTTKVTMNDLGWPWMANKHSCKKRFTKPTRKIWMR